MLTLVSNQYMVSFLNVFPFCLLVIVLSLSFLAHGSVGLGKQHCFPNIILHPFYILTVVGDIVILIHTLEHYVHWQPRVHPYMR